MLQFRRSFEAEKHQLQELNNRLGQYLSRTKQLEHENAILITEINKIRQEKTVEWESKCMAEMRDLRRMVGQLSFEKSRVEMEREKLWQEFQMLQSMCSEEQVLCKDVGGELKGCEKQLHKAQQTNEALEERLFQLEKEYAFLEDSHKQEISKLRSQAYTRPIVTQTYHGRPVVSMEEIQECALSLSEGWVDTFEMYRRKLEEMEESIKLDQMRLDDLQREKMHYASELDTLGKEAKKQAQIQIHLEEQLINMQDNFHCEITQYQVIIEELERERQMLANTMAEKVRDHQELLQVKMDLGMEVAYYRALIEGEHQHHHHQSRERIIDIKMIPPQHYSPRGSTSTRQDVRRHLDVKYMEPTSSLRRPPVPTQYGRSSPSRVVPISVTGSSYNRNQSPASRRDMVSFSKSQAMSSSSSSTTRKSVPESSGRNLDSQRKVVEERSVKVKELSQHSSKNSGDQSQGTTSSQIASPTAELKSVKIVSPPMMSLGRNPEGEEENRTKAEKQVERQGKGDAFDFENVNAPANEGSITDATKSDKTVLDAVSVKELIEVMQPIGYDQKVCSPSPDAKVTYHVEKTLQEDGSTKTQIIMESKVQEELDLSEDSAIDALMSKGVKHMSLEEIKGTATGDMIEHILSLGLQGREDMENKYVNVEIFEEPVEHYSDNEIEFEEQSSPKFSQPSSMVFQIEELDNDQHGTKYHESTAEEIKASATTANYGSNVGSVKVQEDSRDTESPYYSHDQELQEYFVSTPDENLSEPEEAGGIASYGHYGVVDDLSDERYYEEGGLSRNQMFVEGGDRPASESQYMKGDHSLSREGFPECIIEEDTIYGTISPTVQESMFGYLNESAVDPKEQLEGVLEQLPGTISENLKEELSLFTSGGRGSPQNMSVDIKKVHHSSDNGTTTIVAELKSSTTLEDSGLMEQQRDDTTEKQDMAALHFSHHALGAEGGYTLDTNEMRWVTGSGEQGGQSITEVTEKHIKLGPSEKSFTFQMDVNNSQGQDTPLKVIHEKKIATVYLEANENKF
ncbi:hypothetical protein UPYG_G00264510 [Umbra pygmaea]|uniref:IF rod domain-containing protein n=1 Tax=Umbra pygmaea TaxID=75934 RepID=A0ABD0W9N1_UMBPY